MTIASLPITRTSAPPARGLLRTPLLLLVLFYQSLLLALSQIWSNKMRSVLTTIGIVIGVASVTAVIAALTGMKTSVLKEFENLGTNKVFVFPRRPETGKLRNASFREILQCLVPFVVWRVGPDRRRRNAGVTEYSRHEPCVVDTHAEPQRPHPLGIVHATGHLFHDQPT
jgi:hypothetical protein